jgi:urease accessory protein
MKSALLLLSDGRWPAGGHAHSGGLEEAVAAGRVGNQDELAAYLMGRLTTVGRCDAALAAVACFWAEDTSVLARLETEAAARCPSAALRAASRSQGRGLLRTALATWGGHMAAADLAGPRGLMYPVALGACAHRAGLPPGDAALLAAQGGVAAAGWAATRLLGLDPYLVARCLVALGATVEAEAAAAAALVPGGDDALDDVLAALPATGAPLTDLGGEAHARWEVRLFAS